MWVSRVHIYQQTIPRSRGYRLVFFSQDVTQEAQKAELAIPSTRIARSRVSGNHTRQETMGNGSSPRQKLVEIFFCKTSWKLWGSSTNWRKKGMWQPTLFDKDCLTLWLRTRRTSFSPREQKQKKFWNSMLPRNVARSLDPRFFSIAKSADGQRKQNKRNGRWCWKLIVYACWRFLVHGARNMLLQERAGLWGAMCLSSYSSSWICSLQNMWWGPVTSQSGKRSFPGDTSNLGLN